MEDGQLKMCVTATIALHLSQNIGHVRELRRDVFIQAELQERPEAYREISNATTIQMPGNHSTQNQT